MNTDQRALRAYAACLLLPVLTAGQPAAEGQPEQARLLVVNRSAAVRQQEPVVVPWSQCARILPSAPAGVRLSDEQGTEVPCQLDDLDGNGTPDELTFLADLPAKGRRTFLLLPAEAGARSGAGATPRTDAQNWKRVDGVLRSVDDDDLAGNRRERSAYRFDGVGWESELIGYRLYLDGRNAVDVQGKRRPQLQWKYIGSTDVDYQLDHDWGMDVLHIGPALGVGGIGFWSGDSVNKPIRVDHQRCMILARGPVRAVVRVDYTGWQIGSEKVDVSSLFTIYAGARVSEHRVMLSGSGGPARILATGIVKHDSTSVLWRPREGWLVTSGHQSRAGDTLMMALCVDPSGVVRRTEDSVDHLLLLRLRPGTPQRILLAASWQGERGRAWTAAETEQLLRSASRRLREPLQVEVTRATMGPQ